MNLIVSRHKGAVDWLKARGIEGEVKEHVEDPKEVSGKDVYGALPNNLAWHTRSVTSIDMPKMTPEQRGKDLTPQEMDAAGATLSTYIILKVPPDQVDYIYKKLISA